MSSSSSTPPARKPAGRSSRGGGGASRTRTVWTWALLSVWAVLIAFGLVSMTNPQWLERMSMKGAQAEASVYRHFGDNELKKGNYRLAIAQYLRALEISGEQPDVCVNLGLAYLRLGDVGRSESVLREASRMKTTPDLRSLIALSMGEIREREGRLDDAVRLYSEALGKGARPSLVHQKLGTLYLRAKDYEGARSAFEAILGEQTDPLHPYREMLRRSRERADEDSELAAWLESAGTQTPAPKDWARYDPESIDRMHESDPEIAKTHNHLGLIFHRLGDLEASIAHFEQSLAIWPGNADAVRNLKILRSERATQGS